MPFSLSEPVVDALLDKLSTSDSFRETFKADPRAALVEVGHKAAADPGIKEGAWLCLSCNELASKEMIKETRDTLRKQLVTSQAGHAPISLEMQKKP